jgi:predicted HD superfamily hydrolase involved in NAD metabolism
VIDHFAGLVPLTDPSDSVQRFYTAAGLDETWQHVTAVAAEARILAARHGAPDEAANLAALAHDLAAGIPVLEMPAVAESMGVRIGDADRAIPIILHGPIAAAALRAKLNLQNEDVLNAVRYHTTLRAGAGTLEKVVFLADKLAYDPKSPHQGDYVEAMRSTHSLDEAALIYLDFLLENAWRYKWYPHPNALAAYREMVRRVPS